MNNKFLVINAGSSSLKFSLYEMPKGNEIVNGYVEKIGKEDSFYTLKFNGQKVEKQKSISNHTDAVQIMLDELLENKFINDVTEIKGVGHRVLHGGEFYSESVLIDDEVLNNIKSLIPLGPLHIPGAIDGIEGMQSVMPNIPQIAVWDTAFHQTIEEENYMYPVPYEWYIDNKVRRYGFHGTSHKYITEKMAETYGYKNLIICHIGSGASLSCIKDSKCINTTMGLTPLEGTMMGTRSGTIDPSIIEYICKERNLTVEEVTSILNKQSGLLGIGGVNDYRDINTRAENGDERAKLAIKMFEKSIIRYIAQYYVELNGEVDAIVFTAGIGENNIEFRANIVNALEKPLNIKLNASSNDIISKNKSLQSGFITTNDSNINVLVEPTDEEYMILKDTFEIVENMKNIKRKTK